MSRTKMTEEVQDGNAAALEVIKLIEEKLGQLRGYMGRQTFKLEVLNHVKKFK
jgi:hypothetical protein